MITFKDSRPGQLIVGWDEVVDGRWHSVGQRTFSTKVELWGFSLDIEPYPTMSGCREAIVLSYIVNGEKRGDVVETLPKDWRTAFAV